jgi:hypothetical protein
VAVLRGYRHNGLKWSEFSYTVPGITFSAGGETKQFEAIGSVFNPSLRQRDDDTQSPPFAFPLVSGAGADDMTADPGRPKRSGR